MGSKQSVLIMEKNCTKCGESKSLTCFFKDQRAKDGRQNRCKTCQSKYCTQYRKSNIDSIRAYDRARGNRYSAKDQKRYAKNNPIKERARTKINTEIRAGRLERPKNCEECGVSCKCDGHHDDYAKVLDVRWLCRICHLAWHTKNGAGLNG